MGNDSFLKKDITKNALELYRSDLFKIEGAISVLL